MALKVSTISKAKFVPLSLTTYNLLQMDFLVPR